MTSIFAFRANRTSHASAAAAAAAASAATTALLKTFVLLLSCTLLLSCALLVASPGVTFASDQQADQADQASQAGQQPDPLSPADRGTGLAANATTDVDGSTGLAADADGSATGAGALSLTADTTNAGSASGSGASGSGSTTAAPWTLTSKGFVNESGSIIANARAKGVDVSQWQGKIDWEKVQADGVQFAIIRCGWGDNDESQDDATFEYNVSECERLGIPYGVYLYSYAYSNTMAASEAKHTLRLLEGHNPSLGVYLDIEETIDGKPGVSYANRFLSNSQLLSQAKIFCNAIENAGYRAGIYSSTTFFNKFLTSTTYDKWLRWLAHWCDAYTYNGRVEVWQCASDGKVDGISGDADIDMLMYTDLRMANVSLSKSAVYYNGVKQKPAVKVTAGGVTLTEGTDYTVTITNEAGEVVTGCGPAGTYQITVTGIDGADGKGVGPTGNAGSVGTPGSAASTGSIGNIVGSQTVTFKVLKRSIEKCNVELTYPTSQTLTYNGKVRTPSITVKCGSIRLIKNKHYTVEYSGDHKNVGTYTITVTGIGSLKGAVTKTFTIVPKTVTLKSAVSTKAGSATVAWSSLPTNISGYIIQRSTSSKFTSYLPMKWSGFSTTESTFGGLTSGKTYYFRIRTYKKVDGVTYYSKWSNVVSTVVK